MSESRQKLEKAILGACIAEPARVMAICAMHKIDESWFTSAANRAVWTYLDSQKSDPLKIDLLSVGIGIKDHVPQYYEEELFRSCPSDAHAEYYVESLRDYWTRDRLRFLAHSIEGMADSEEDKPDSIIASVQTELATLQPPEQKRTVTEVYDAMLQRWQRSGDSERIAIPSRFPRLQSMLGGYRRGKLYVIAARPGIGKTTVVCNEAKTMCDAGMRVAVASLEMDEEELRGRIICEDCDLSQFALDTGGGTQYHFDKVARAIPKHRDYHLRICDDGGMGPSRLCAWMTNEVITHKADIIFIDYLQIIMGDGVKFGSRNDELTATMNMIRATAKRLRVPVVALSQFRKAPHGQNEARPTLDDLRDTGSIAQDVYGAIVLHRPKLDSEDCEWGLLKNRGGPVGWWDMKFEGNRQRYSEPPRVSDGRTAWQITGETAD